MKKTLKRLLHLRYALRVLPVCPSVCPVHSDPKAFFCPGWRVAPSLGPTNCHERKKDHKIRGLFLH